MARKNLNHDLIINSSGDANNPSLRINNASSNTYNHSIESFNSNLTSGETELILVGKEGSTKNSGYLGYYWSAAGSDDNYVSIGHWSANHLLKVYGSGSVVASTNMQAPIFYDTNNNSYYLDPANTSTSLKVAGGIITTAASGSILLEHQVSEANAWLFQENAGNWGTFWFNTGSESGQTFGGYTTAGAEFVGFRHSTATNSINPNAWTGIDTSANATWLLSNYSGYIWSAGTQYSATDMRAPIFYDSTSTAYYLNPPSTTRLNSLDIWNGGIQQWYRSGGNAHQRVDARLDGSDQARMHWYGKDDTGNTRNFKHAWYDGSGYVNVTAASDFIYFDRASGTVSVQADGDFRAPIFYDTDSTTYYVNPADRSYLAEVFIPPVTSAASGATIRTYAWNDPNWGFSTFASNPNYHVRVHGYGNAHGTDRQFQVVNAYASNAVQLAVNFDGTGTAIGAAGTESGYKLTVHGSVHMKNDDINYVNQLHFNDNLRFVDEGNNNYLKFRWGSNANGGIKFVDGGDALQGYVYGSGNGEFGILDKDGHWTLITDGATYTALRSNNNQELTVYNDRVEIDADLRSPIFYDKDDTTYFIDPTASTSIKVSGNAYLGRHIDALNAWDGTGNSRKAIFVGWYSDKVILGNNDDGGHDTAYNFNDDAVISVNPFYSYMDITSRTALRSPIFYDSDDTGRYVNPAGTSSFGTIHMNNNNLTNVNHITINDPGGGEGIEWLNGNGWKIYESPDDLSNASGNLQFVTGSTRLGTLTTAGNLELSGSVGSGSDSVAKVLYPKGATYEEATNNVTGAIKITLPQSWSNTMMKIHVSVFDYSSDESFDLILAGYNYSGDGGYWTNCTSQAIASPNEDKSFNIRYGHDGTKCCIFIGETTSTWSYPKVVVTKFMGGHSNYSFSKWDDGWDITRVTSLASNIDITQVAYQQNRYIQKLYDIDDTNYLLDPSSLSKLSSLSIGTTGAPPNSSYVLNMGGHIDMNAQEINYVSQLHFNDNVRFYDNGDDSFLNFKFGDASTGGIRFINGSDALTGLVYANSAGFGLLDSDAQWAVRSPVGGSGLELRSNNNVEFTVNDDHTLSHGSSRAPIFYDSNDTSYYVNPAGDSQMDQIHLANYVRHLGDLDTYFGFNGADQWKLHIGGGDRVVANTSTLTSNLNFQAPIFYDSNDTAYYVNPASTSNMVQGYYKGKTDGWSLQLGDASLTRVYDDDARASLVINAAYYPHLYINANTSNSNTNHGAVFSMTGNISGGGFRRWSMGIPNLDPNMLTIGTYDNNANPHYGCGGDVLGEATWGSKLWLDSSSNLQTNGSMRSPIFYDSNDTNYYINPSSNSQFSGGLAINTTSWDTTNLKLDVNGAVSLRQGFYMGISTNNYNSWQGRIYNSGSGQYWSGQAWYFNGTGWGGGNYWTLDNSGNSVAAGSHRAPIFYDSNDTNYYVDPANTNLSVKVYGEISNSNYVAGNLQPGSLNIGRTDTDYAGITTWSSDVKFGILANCNNNWEFGIHDSAASVESVFLYQNTNGLITMGRDVGWGTTPIVAANSFRAPIFYDSDNTGYYTNPNGTSVMSALTLGSTFTQNGGDFITHGTQTGDLNSFWQLGGTGKNRGIATGRFQSGASNSFTSANNANWIMNIYSHAGSGGAYPYGIQLGGTDTGDRNLMIRGISNGTFGSWARVFHENSSDLRSPIFYDSADTTYYVDPNSGSQSGLFKGNLRFNNYGAGIVGLYSATKYQLVFAMGDAYKGAIDGSNVTGGYGLWYSHPNAGGVAANLSNHGLMNIANGTWHASLASSTRASVDMRAPIFYDLADSNYYVDPANTGTAVYVKGDVVAYGASDERLKDNIKPIDNALDKVCSLSGNTFEWNEISHRPTGKKDIGVIAQEVEKVFPEIVDTRDSGYKAVYYEKLTAILIEAVKELKEEVKELKDKCNGCTK